MLYELFFVFRRRCRLKEKFGVLFVVNGTRRINHDVATRVVFGECDEIPNGIATAKQRAQAVKTQREATMGGSAVLESIHEETKLCFGFFRGKS